MVRELERKEQEAQLRGPMRKSSKRDLKKMMTKSKASLGKSDSQDNS
jgi:hypothetical protein